jgi:hypothetical protein
MERVAERSGSVSGGFPNVVARFDRHAGGHMANAIPRTTGRPARRARISHARMSYAETPGLYLREEMG